MFGRIPSYADRVPSDHIRLPLHQVALEESSGCRLAGNDVALGVSQRQAAQSSDSIDAWSSHARGGT